MIRNPDLAESLAWLKKVMADKGIEHPTALARGAGLDPTTINRPFYAKTGTYKRRISLTTLQAISSKYRVPLPDHWGVRQPASEDQLDLEFAMRIVAELEVAAPIPSTKERAQATARVLSILKEYRKS